MRAQTEERVERAEEMLCAGFSAGKVEQLLAKEYAVTTRQARNYIGAVYKRWGKQNEVDAPHRREKLVRMTERFYAKALMDKQYTAASQALNLLARMTGAFAEVPQTDAMVAVLGPVPTDPTQMLLYAQKAMAYALSEVVSNPALDPEKRLRWISEIGGKIGLTHAKALVQHKLEEVASRVLPEYESEQQADSTIDAAEWSRLKDA